MASRAAPIASSPREIRVFISSTFRDMQEEREELVKQIVAPIASAVRHSKNWNVQETSRNRLS
jgi:hypothetical protein